MKRLIAFFVSPVLILVLILLLVSPFGSGPRATGERMKDGSEQRNVRLILTLDDSVNTNAALTAQEVLPVAAKYCEVSLNYTDDLFVMLDCTGREADIAAAEQALCDVVNIAAVERDAELSLLALTDDYFSDSQYWLDNQGEFTKYMGSGPEVRKTTPDIDVDAPEGWAAYAETTPARMAIVAVIDTGIDYQHPDLADSMWVNKGEIPGNGIDDDGNGYIDDIYGWDFYNDDSSICHYEYNELYAAELASQDDNDNHGTHCAGIIAAVKDNGIGISGIASAADVRLMSLKIHGGTDLNGSISSLIKAVHYADMMGADVCNVSWGLYLYSAAMHSAIAHSHMLFVCAAGNDGSDNDVNPLYPASYDLDNIIAVTFTGTDGKLVHNSNYGRSSVDVAVPAVDMFSTVVGTYGLLSGSSMAAPQVSAIAAVLYTYGDGMYASNVRDVILSGVKHLSSCETLMTHPGLASLAGAVKASDAILYDNEIPELSVSEEFDEDKLLLTFNALDDGSGVCNLRYFTGKRKSSYFRNGTAGTEIDNKSLFLSKSGIYTFYVDDYAGNTAVKTLRITDDWAGPDISDITLSVNTKQTKLTVTANVTDSQSGIRNVKYMKGSHTAADFTGKNAETLEPDEDDYVKFSVTEEGTYTIYASDMRGNATVALVYAYIRQSTSLTLAKVRKTLDPEATWAIKATMEPEYTTDRLTYSSSDETVATVSPKGIVTAIASGSCTITVRTSSGKTATCKVKVR